jgi:hypothetical protein
MQEALNLMAQTMDGIEDEYPGCEIGDVLVVVEMRLPNDQTNLRTICSDRRMHVQLGLLHGALFATFGDR